jgi:hypothetical protein
MHALRWLRRLRAGLLPIQRRLGVRFVVDRVPDHRRTVFIAGSGRSGTTWVSEVLNYRNDYRYVFEPLSNNVSATAPFGGKRYLRPDDDEPELLEIMRRVLTGQIRSAWTERFNRRFVADRRLVKEIRANLLLEWVRLHFPGMPIVVVLRHPCAVAASFVRQGWRGRLEDLLAQDPLVRDFLSSRREELAGLHDRFEKAVAIWCIETLVPLRQLGAEGVHVAFYEHLVRDPELELGRLFAFLGRDDAPQALARLERPSLTSRRERAASSSEERMAGWRRQLSGDEIRRALTIVRSFGLDCLYGDGPLPDPQGLTALRASGGAGLSPAPASAR